MLLDFRFKNFRSFRDETRLCLVKPDYKHDLKDGVHVVSAIYGANASGKTNVTNAFAIMRGSVLGNSSKNSADPMAYQPFAFDENDEPYLSEVTFSIGEIIYRYGFLVSKTEVLGEWLFRYDDFVSFVSNRERKIFTRGGGEVEGELAGELLPLLPKTRANMFLLVKLDQENELLARQIMEWFKNLTVLKAFSDTQMYGYSHEHILQQSHKDRMMELIRFADPTIVSVAERQLTMPDPRTGQAPVQVEFVRNNISGSKLISLPFEEYESAGTQKMFCMSGPFVDIIKNGYTVIVDELDAKFHPLLTRKIVGQFTNPEINLNAAQLIMTTHDVELIRAGVVKQDQVRFCDKNEAGVSAMYSLDDFAIVRKIGAEDVARKYLEGVFGAVPGFTINI